MDIRRDSEVQGFARREGEEISWRVTFVDNFS